MHYMTELERASSQSVDPYIGEALNAANKARELMIANKVELEKWKEGISKCKRCMRYDYCRKCPKEGCWEHTDMSDYCCKGHDPIDTITPEEYLAGNETITITFTQSKEMVKASQDHYEDADISLKEASKALIREIIHRFTLKQVVGSALKPTHKALLTDEALRILGADNMNMPCLTLLYYFFAIYDERGSHRMRARGTQISEHLDHKSSKERNEFASDCGALTYWLAAPPATSDRFRWHDGLSSRARLDQILASSRKAWIRCLLIGYYLDDSWPIKIEIPSTLLDYFSKIDLSEVRQAIERTSYAKTIPSTWFSLHKETRLWKTRRKNVFKNLNPTGTNWRNISPVFNWTWNLDDFSKASLEPPANWAVHARNLHAGPRGRPQWQLGSAPVPPRGQPRSPRRRTRSPPEPLPKPAIKVEDVETPLSAIPPWPARQSAKTSD